MSNEDRVAKLEKKLDVTLIYSDVLRNKKSSKIDEAKLEKLAKRIRQELEEMSLETPIYSNTRI